VTSDGLIKSRRTARVSPDINITPLVDVVLVLLIIFMVVAPQMEQDIPVTLPGIFNPDPDMEGQAAPEMVTMTKEGEFHVDSQKYDLDGAVAQLNAVHSADPYKRLALRADAGLKYKDVRSVFFRLQEVGFPGMSLMVSHRYQAGGENSVPAVQEAPPAQADAQGNADSTSGDPGAATDAAAPAPAGEGAPAAEPPAAPGAGG
jgi:biopolymer transport protein ExbD